MTNLTLNHVQPQQFCCGLSSSALGRKRQRFLTSTPDIVQLERCRLLERIAMTHSVSGDDAGRSFSLLAGKAPVNNKNKDIVRASTKTSLRLLSELITFKSLVAPSKSVPRNLHSHDPPATRRYASLSTSSSSATVVGNNEDLLLQILLLLSPKSLIRFQCVSRQWLSLISSPRFHRLHSARHTFSSTSEDDVFTESGLLFYRRIYGTSEFKSISLLDGGSNSVGMMASRFENFLNEYGQILGLHFCNGFIWVDFFLRYEVRRYYVYNPTTNQCRLIPLPNIQAESQRIEAVNIVFDPFEPDKCRLICVFAKLVDGEEAWGEFIFWQYSSETQVWKNCGDIDIWDQSNYNYYFEKGVYWNGNLYWTNSARALLCFDLELECVVSLNMMIVHPPSPDGIIFYFSDSGGSLYLIDLHKPKAEFLDVWELELNMGLGRYHSRWLLKYHIDLGILTARYPLMLDEKFVDYCEKQFPFGIPYFLVNEKEHKAKLMISLPGKIIFYEINDMTFEELVEIEPADVKFVRYNMSIYTWKDAFKHFETLACV